VLPWALLLPLIAVMVGVVGYPVVRTIWLSLHEGQFLRTGSFVGLKNYRNIFDDPDYTAALVRTTIFAIAVVAATMFISLAIALVLDNAPRAAKLLTVVVLLPWAMPRVASGIIWKWMFNDQYGVINWVLVKLGFSSFKGYSWFNSGTPAMIAITIAVVWHSVPFVAISLLAGLRSTHGEVVEAARVDGANAWQRFRKVTLPLLLPSIGVVSILTFIGSMNTFELVYSLEGAQGNQPTGPGGATDVLGLIFYRVAFQEGGVNAIGQSSALAVLLFLFTFGIAVVANRVVRRREASLS
jgi:ABC-type sugar transport system permease subunit